MWIYPTLRNVFKSEEKKRETRRKGVRYVEQTIVEVAGSKIKVPKPLLDFLDSFLAFTKITPEEFWQRETIATIECLLDLSGPWMKREDMIERYGLKEALRGFGGE